MSFPFRNPDPRPTWADRATRPLWRFLDWLGKQLDPADDLEPAPLAGIIAAGQLPFCGHHWSEPGTPDLVHDCSLLPGHDGPAHRCDCGAECDHLPLHDKLLRLVAQPAWFDDCTWPLADLNPCPRHDLRRPWPVGRDCRGTCTNCNSTTAEWHAPSCPHYTEETP